MTAVIPIAKSEALHEVLLAAEADQLRWEHEHGVLGSYRIYGIRVDAPQSRTAAAIAKLIKLRAIRHTVGGVPRGSGPIELTQHGAELLAEWGL